MSSKKEIIKQPHHEKKELCFTRAKYRQGRKLTAVKVYTVNDESPHLLISGVPSLGLQDDLKRVGSKFGDIKSLVLVPGYSEEEFTDTFHIQYSRVQSARYAKRRLDGLSFYGGVLHVCYAPEMETVAETRAKLVQRRKDVACRINGREPRPMTSSRLKPFKDMKRTYIGRDILGMHFKKQVMGSESDSGSCIWKGQQMEVDPRLNTESSQAVEYGPSLPVGYKPEPVNQNAPLAAPAQFHETFNWSSKNKFIPRQVSVKKAIIFRKSSNSEKDEALVDEESRIRTELAEDDAVIATHTQIKETLKTVSVPNMEINLPKGESFLDMK